MTTPTLQVAIDAADPHLLNRFWASAMDYEIEDHHDGIEQVVAAGYTTYDDTILIDGRRAWRDAAACRPRDGASGARLLFQAVPESKTVKNRVHLDLHVADGERDALIARLLEQGATKLWDGQQGPQTWVTLADPEGNEFCIS